MRPIASAVKRLAVARGLPLLQPERLGAQQADEIRTVRPDVLVVAAYGILLPAGFLDLASHGAFNIHASLLPRWRGAAPIQRALLAGDRETGISIMQMDAGLDTGPVVARHPLEVTSEDDAGSLHDRLASLGAEAIVDALASIEAGTARAVAQPVEGVTYAPKITHDDVVLEWSQPARALERAVRAFRPSPGATTTLQGERIKVWRSHVVDGHGQPGSVLATADALIVACGEGALAITELQRAGGKPLPAAEFLRGRTILPGVRLE